MDTISKTFLLNAGDEARDYFVELYLHDLQSQISNFDISRIHVTSIQGSMHIHHFLAYIDPQKKNSGGFNNEGRKFLGVVYQNGEHVRA